MASFIKHQFTIIFSPPFCFCCPAIVLRLFVTFFPCSYGSQSPCNFPFLSLSGKSNVAGANTGFTGFCCELCRFYSLVPSWCDCYTSWQTQFLAGGLTSADVRSSQFQLLQHQQFPTSCSFGCWTVAGRGLKFLVVVMTPSKNLQGAPPLKYPCGLSPLF